MKMNTRYIKIIVPVVAILATAGAFAGIPALRERFVASSLKQETAIAETAVKKDISKQEKDILKEMSAILHGMDTLAALTITGTVNVNDQADSTSSMSTMFTYTRQGKEGYYRIGDSEMASLNEAYIVVSNDVKKIFISPARSLANPVKLPVTDEVGLLENEGYAISRQVSCGIMEIALLNSKHISCREYRLSYDSTGRIYQVNMRLSEPSDMADLQKDKLINVTVNSWSSVASRKDLLKMDRYVTMKDGVLTPSGLFSGYDVINDL
jgi:ATP-dependent protease HslVU (ClpYQ) peptidase subunit